MDLEQIEAGHAPLSARRFDLARPPARREEIQTFSAENRPAGCFSLSRPYPITFCDDPYIGDELIMRPPSSKKARMTSAQASRATGSSPTLKVIQLPSPTTGMASPLDGIGR